jgi:hypothetical protein
MASTSEIRNGLCIEYNHDIFTIVEFQHVKPGKDLGPEGPKLINVLNRWGVLRHDGANGTGNANNGEGRDRKPHGREQLNALFEQPAAASEF